MRRRPSRRRASAGRGLPPEGWRVGIRGLRRERHADLAHDGTSLGWGTVADGRVQTLSIVEDLDVVEHCCSGLLAGAEVGLMDVLRLERGEEAFHRRIIQAIATSAHRLLEPVAGQHAAIVGASILHAAIAVQDESLFWPNERNVRNLQLGGQSRNDLTELRSLDQGV
jgi:hypothetical protein